MVKIAGNLKNPKVLVIGVFHGDEPQGYYLINKYLQKVPATGLLMIPCLNESGLESGVRVNSNGVDLNRNFPAKNWVLSEKDAFYGGEAPGSEYETKFLIEQIEKFKPKLILTLHAPFRVVNYDGPTGEIANKISEIMDYPVEESIGYPTPGSFGTWAGVERNIPTITLELDEKVSEEDLVEPVFKVFEMLEGLE